MCKIWMSLGYEVHIAVTFLYKILAIAVLQVTLDIAYEFNIWLRLFGLLEKEINLIKNKPNCFIVCCCYCKTLEQGRKEYLNSTLCILHYLKTHKYIWQKYMAKILG